MNKVQKLITIMKEDGPQYIAYKIRKKLQGKINRKIDSFALSGCESKEIEQSVCFSVLVPVYNTPERLLREMIESVIAQSYSNWELCLADGSDDAHGYVGEICRTYVNADSRIRYQKLRENKGISGNTNACIEMSTGDYIALFDHDDLLHPSALYEVALAIKERDADFIYTDETLFYESPADAYSPHFKPDYSPDTLRSYNYITHFSVFSRSLMERVGAFRSDFDGSQDYDMILRLTEQAEEVVHIPKILYYWRNHPGSVASDVSVKPYTMESARKALAEHLGRVGLEGTVEDSSVLTTYRIRYKIRGNPLVSVIIKDGPKRNACAQLICDKTTYSNYEIVYEGMANGEYLVFVDDASQDLSPDWIEQLLMFAQRSDVGAVGGMVRYKNGTVCTAGKILGVRGTVADAHPRFPMGHDGYKFRLTLAQNYSAVSRRLMMVRRTVWERFGGFDRRFGVLCDADLCMRIREAGYQVVWTPYAEATCEDGVIKKPSKDEMELFRGRWKKELEQGDPYYNPNLTLLRGDFSEK